MGRRAFIDLTEKKLTVRVLENNRKNGFSAGVSCDVSPGYSFTLENTAGTTEESVLSIPLGLLNFRIIELPFSDIKKIRELLPIEIDGLVLGGAKNVVFDALVLGKTGGKYRILVACLSKGTLRTMLEKLKKSGFDPISVTCLELARILASDASGADIGGLLVAPPQISDEERAVSGLREMERPTLNLRRDEFAYTVDTEKNRKSLRMTIALAAFLAVIFFAGAAMTIRSLNMENAQLRDSMRKAYIGLFPDETRITSGLYQLKAHIKELREKESSIAGISPLVTLLDLSHTVKPGISIIEIDQDRETVVLRGECSSLSDVQKFRNDLQSTLNDVVVADTKPSPRNRILFTVTAKVKKT